MEGEPKLAEIVAEDNRWTEETAPRFELLAKVYVDQVAGIMATRPHDGGVVRIAGALKDGRDAIADKATAALFTELTGIAGEPNSILMLGNPDRPVCLEDNVDWIEIVIPRIEQRDYRRLKWDFDRYDTYYLVDVVDFTLNPCPPCSPHPDSPDPRDWLEQWAEPYIMQEDQQGAAPQTASSRPPPPQSPPRFLGRT